MNRKSERGFARVLLAAVMLLFLAVPLVAQPTQRAQEGRAEAEAAIAQLRSPYCPGRMLENCTSSLAGALRDSIYDLAAQGAGTGELVEWMLANHGEEYRGVPQGRGAGLWAWIVPPAAVLAAIGLLFVWFRSNRSSSRAAVSPLSSNLSDADRTELADALRNWEQSGEASR